MAGGAEIGNGALAGVVGRQAPLKVLKLDVMHDRAVIHAAERHGDLGEGPEIFRAQTPLRQTTHANDWLFAASAENGLRGKLGIGLLPGPMDRLQHCR